MNHRSHATALPPTNITHNHIRYHSNTIIHTIASFIFLQQFTNKGQMPRSSRPRSGNRSADPTRVTRSTRRRLNPPESCAQATLYCPYSRFGCNYETSSGTSLSRHAGQCNLRHLAVRIADLSQPGSTAPFSLEGTRVGLSQGSNLFNECFQLCRLKLTLSSTTPTAARHH